MEKKFAYPVCFKVTEENQAEIEEWRNVPNFEDLYQVSSLGNVRKWLKNPRNKQPRWKVLKHNSKLNYYRVYTFVSVNNRAIWAIHRLVLSVFKPVENWQALQVNHKDLNKKNNSVSNLEWCTSKENSNHKIKNLKMYGENLSYTKITNLDVLEIINLKKSGMLQKDIAIRFNVCDAHISDIIKGKKRKYVERTN